MSITVGYVRGYIRHPEKPQEDELVKAGATVIYREGRDAETFAECARALQRGDTLKVTSLARLGPTRDDLRRNVLAVLKRKAVIVETRTGRRTDNAESALLMLLDAVDELSQDRRAYTPTEAKKAARKRWAEKRGERAPRAAAEKIWKDTERYKTIAEAMAHPDMEGWTVRQAYRAFDPRGTTVGGRPRKAK